MCTRCTDILIDAWLKFRQYRRASVNYTSMGSCSMAPRMVRELEAAIPGQILSI